MPPFPALTASIWAQPPSSSSSQAALHRVPHRGCTCPCNGHPSGTRPAELPAELPDIGLTSIEPPDPLRRMRRSHAPQSNAPLENSCGRTTWAPGDPLPHQAVPPSCPPDAAGPARPLLRPVLDVKPATEPGAPNRSFAAPVVKPENQQERFIQQTGEEHGMGRSKREKRQGVEDNVE